MIFEKQIEAIYRRNLFVRQDNAQGFFYFAPADFPGLRAHPYAFKAKGGHDLRGCFYYYENPIPGRLLVFDHGMGNGHRAYLREIETLCKAGFLVFSYDHTGCMESGGTGCNGFATSLSDLDDCITALEGEKELNDRAISVMGHSWGGFSTMNIAALHPQITHLVAMSGFVSVGAIVNQTFTGLLKGYRKTIMDLERQSNPGYVDFHAGCSLADTSAKVLLISSDDDKVVPKAQHFDRLQQMLAGRENVRFLVVPGRNHNPTYTADAVTYKDAFMAEHKKMAKKLTTPEKQRSFMARYDWRRMTEQEPGVWAQFIGHLRG